MSLILALGIIIETKVRLTHSRQAAAHAGLASFLQACGGMSLAIS